MNPKIKKVVYRYNGDPRQDESVLDWEGSLPMPLVGQILKMHGKEWKVAIIDEDLVMARQKAIPIYRVFLTDKL